MLVAEAPLIMPFTYATSFEHVRPAASLKGPLPAPRLERSVPSGVLAVGAQYLLIKPFPLEFFQKPIVNAPVAAGPQTVTTTVLEEPVVNVVLVVNAAVLLYD